MATGDPKQHCFHYRRHHQYDNQGLERYFIYYPREMYDPSYKSDEENRRYSKIHTSRRLVPQESLPGEIIDFLQIG